MHSIVPLAAQPPDAIEALLDRAFGSDRRARTAYRVRGSAAWIAALSFAGLDADGVLIGTVQCWPVRFSPDRGPDVPMTMVGPVAVDPARQRGGIGRRLLAASLDAAAAARLADALMLIGDPEYYGRFFGFSADATAGWRLPGPVERHRLLARGPRVPTGMGVLGPVAASDLTLYPDARCP